MTDREELARLMDMIDWHNMSPLDMADLLMGAGWRRCGQCVTQHCPEAEKATAQADASDARANQTQRDLRAAEAEAARLREAIKKASGICVESGSRGPIVVLEYETTEAASDAYHALVKP